MELEDFLAGYPADKQTRPVDIALAWMAVKRSGKTALAKVGLKPWVESERWRRGYAVEAHTFLANEMFLQAPPAEQAEASAPRAPGRRMGAAEILRGAQQLHAEGE
jgi:hypothetical protein